ncbi:MAG: hypothetical protein EON56_02900, partial [Alphaproteobacteria bacterium]
MIQSVTPQSAGLSEDALSRLDAAIQQDIDKGLNLGASIIVAKAGHIVHRRTFGTVAPRLRPLSMSCW